MAFDFGASGVVACVAGESSPRSSTSSGTAMQLGTCSAFLLFSKLYRSAADAYRLLDRSPSRRTSTFVGKIRVGAAAVQANSTTWRSWTGRLVHFPDCHPVSVDSWRAGCTQLNMKHFFGTLGILAVDLSTAYSPLAGTAAYLKISMQWYAASNTTNTRCSCRDTGNEAGSASTCTTVELSLSFDTITTSVWQ